MNLFGNKKEYDRISINTDSYIETSITIPSSGKTYKYPCPITIKKRATTAQLWSDYIDQVVDCLASYYNWKKDGTKRKFDGVVYTAYSIGDYIIPIGISNIPFAINETLAYSIIESLAKYYRWEIIDDGIHS